MQNKLYITMILKLDIVNFVSLYFTKCVTLEMTIYRDERNIKQLEDEFYKVPKRFKNTRKILILENNFYEIGQFKKIMLLFIRQSNYFT